MLFRKGTTDGKYDKMLTFTSNQGNLCVIKHHIWPLVNLERLLISCVGELMGTQVLLTLLMVTLSLKYRLALVLKMCS